MKTKELKYYDVIVAIFVAVLLISNIVSTKLTSVGPLLFDAGTILFPFAYIFGDILTEVYGYKRARRTIWLGFVSLLIMSVTLLIVQALPAADVWDNQSAYESILGLVPRIALASLCGYLVGEFANSFVLAKLKVKTNGRMLWLRTISSTVVGSALDTLVFSVIAFSGILPASELWQLVATVYGIKLFVEIVCTPVTYVVVGWLKKAEGIDVYDRDTNFSPFSSQ
jgi:uncharacterized integral membrane protein (TIGR00697 family)